MTAPGRGAHGLLLVRAALGRNPRIAAAAAALLAGVAAALAWQAMDEDSTAPRRALAPATVSRGGDPTYAHPRLGYSLRVPATWRVREGRRLTRLLVPGGGIAVAIASPTSGSFTDRVARDARRALLAAYRPARVVRRQVGRLGRNRARIVEIAGASRDTRPLRILSIVTASRWRTYAVAVAAATPPDAGHFVEAQRILASMRFGRPAAP